MYAQKCHGEAKQRVLMDKMMSFAWQPAFDTLDTFEQKNNNHRI